ncbi:MAG TPA: SUMF1/EgtB/PvdO family nonheme iron enzyme [Verrucomicrobiota bacterium]|nr:SUMF1/EgtB/PvdO family nonheme iron enzyme [Verrucomicrobiota bacterium]HNU53027.1 SUMF1/EgtB/PvdO family nonheme iron enzyme [Verrucomicrobiota bacterium]
MKRELARNPVAIVALAVFLVSLTLRATAQSPQDIGGRTIELMISSGTFPFAASGAFRFLPAANDSSYAIVPISGDVVASTGTHTYTKSGTAGATLALVDSGIGLATVSCNFNTPTSGSYALESPAFSGAGQSGTFKLYAGASLTTIVGTSVTVSITSGEAPFATFGSYRFEPAASGNTYAISALSGDVLSSSGTYSYSKDSDYTAALSFDDSRFGQGLSLQLSFDTSTTGTVFLRKPGTTGYQTGLFSMATAGVGPSITEHPAALTADLGTSVTFRVSATGTSPLAYQWRKDGVAIAGATGSTFTIGSVTAADAALYSVAVSNAYGTQTSAEATLLIRTGNPPTILVGPEDVTVFDGQRAQFAVQARGTAPLTYQWRKNGEPVPGATGPEVVIAEVALPNAGTYDVVVRNSLGTATSDAALLTVNRLPHGTPAAWIRSFGVTGDPVESELADPDRDGHAMWEEYVAGTDPMDVQSVLRIRDARPQGGYCTFKVPTKSDRAYQIDYSDDLEEWHTLIEEFQTDETVVTVADPQPIQGMAKRFYRVGVVVVVPPPPGMVRIPAGSFQMGDTFGEGDSDERPVHTVTVSAFSMDRTEVTKVLWDEVRTWALANGYSFDNAGGGKGADHPVQTVSWYDGVKWCNARSQKEGRTPAYYTSAAKTTVYRTGQVDVQNDWVKWDAGYRLPTEAEWEYAARGGLSGMRFPRGDTISHSQANYWSYWESGRPGYGYDVSTTEGPHPDYDVGDWPYTSPVGSFGANGYGLYDMVGNVWEWCWDWYSGAHYGSSASVDLGGAASGSYRVIRGGAWGGSARGCRVTHRSRRWPGDGDDFGGFRSVLPPGQ